MKLKPKLVALLPFTLTALILNLFSVSLFLDSIAFIFGGALVFFLLETYGFRFAFVLSLILGAQIYILYADPASSVFLPVSLISIYLIKRNFRLSLILAGWSFWVLLGWWIYLIFVLNLFNVEELIAVTLALKESVNGLVNVTIASLLVLLYKYYFDRESRISYAELVFVFIVAVSVTQLFLISALKAREEEKHMVKSIKGDIETISKNIRENVVYWLDIHLNAVRELANRLVIWGHSNREQLQKETEAIRRSFTEFHACYIADKNATAITFYPEVNPKGKYMIGTNFSFRPYYKDVKSTLRHTFTEVFVAKFALTPVVGIAAPAVKEGEFIGYAYCGLRLDRIRDIVKEFSLKEGVFITLIDKNGKVITSNREDQKPMHGFERGDLQVTKFGLILETRNNDHGRKNSLRIDTLYHSFFYNELKLREDIGWSVVMEVSLIPYLDVLFSKLNVSFLLLHLFTFISFLISRFLTFVATRPVSKLADSIDVITRNIEKRPDILLPNTNITEIKKLNISFEAMAKKALEYMDELRKLAYYDLLTELPNRTLLKDRIENAIRFAKRNGTRVAVLFIDLDYFKTVNDTLGHEVGDRILAQVAKRLNSVFRSTDTVARFGGDEFVAVIPDLKDINDVVKVTEKVLRVFETPFEVEGEDIYLSASVGIALYPDNGTDPTELIKNADMAMYRAKEEGKNNFAFFTEDMNKKAIEILNTKNRLHKALERGEFSLRYQPIYSIESNSIVGFEALLRWEDPEKGLVSPASFMPILEELGLIREVGAWVMENAFRKAKEWGDKYGIHVSVNISPRQFAERNFVNKVLDIAEKTETESSKLVLEITETSLMKNPEESVKTLKRLKAKGFRVAVDDFGTGYSSLAYLKKLPIDIIKVDMTFTQSMVNSEVDRSIVKAVIDLARYLGLDSLAEGIETREQLEMLKFMGCKLAQGYLFGKPVKEEEAEALIRKEKGL